jgi:hypothetical protein
VVFLISYIYTFQSRSALIETFVGFINTSYKFSLLVFEFTKTRDFPGSLQKPRTFRGQIFSRDMNLNPGTVPGKRERLVTLSYTVKYSLPPSHPPLFLIHTRTHHTPQTGVVAVDVKNKMFHFTKYSLFLVQLVV